MLFHFHLSLRSVARSARERLCVDVLGVQVKRAHVQFTCSAQDRSRIVNRQVLELQPFHFLSPHFRSALAIAAAAPLLPSRALISFA